MLAILVAAAKVLAVAAPVLTGFEAVLVGVA